MSSFFNKLKGKTSGKHNNQGQGEQSFNIQPHPAKTNDPRDLEPPQPGGGLNSKPEYGALHARDPYVPSEEIKNSLPQPASRDELRARSAQLNNRGN
ncbi:hypothetical protein NEOLEDRAFT_1132881 [Neolentinus lepideus HHB14362 ss-1]|uniref:Uncharacterized protein n=1 Tax=Neolentinus lepideus HHB14362 ss-1 TaxID=1314782 RepID=A0A165SYX6_9AGAM|nr:hypothetical protein NEOLEDRAFT_1132881 [Neolentinus lepideus HHB14362 ss-1]